MTVADRRRLWVAMAPLLARLVLGLIFFMAGVNKVFVLTPAGHVAKYFLPFADTFLPTWSLWAVGWTIPFIELGAGALVLAGYRRTLAYASLGVVLATVTFGHLLHDSLYTFSGHVIPRTGLLLLLLLLAPENDRFAVDEWLARRRAGATIE